MRRLGLLFVLSLAAGFASTVSVTIDTTGLSGTSGDLVFDLTGGGGPSGNTASIVGFSTDGTLGSASTTGTVTGSLPGEVDLSVDNSSLFFSEYLTAFTYGTSIAFTLSATENAPGPVSSPDEFALFLLGSDGTTSLIQTSDPTEANSLLIFDIDGSQAGVSTVFSVSDPGGVSATATSGTSAVPEPSFLTLAGCAFLIMNLMSARRVGTGGAQRTEPEAALRRARIR
jgi:hypothetical protein